MHRPSRTRRILKWAGLGLGLTLAGSWGLSLFYLAYYDGVAFFLVVTDGAMTAHRNANYVGDSEWRFNRYDGRRLNPTWRASFDRSATTGTRSLTVPIWIPLVLVAIPTALLWWRDRKPPVGHCQACGYNLTGNTSGVCPECGA